MPLPPEVIESFPEEIRNEPSWEKFNDVGSIAKGYLEAQKKKDSGIPIPDEKAAPEDLEKWKGEHLPKLAARGIIDMAPAKAEDYKVPEGVTPDQNLLKSFVEKVGLPSKLTQKQFEAALAWQSEVNKQMIVPRDAAEAEFKNLLGNDYSSAMEQINSAIEATAEDVPQFGEWRKTAYVVDSTGKAYPFDTHPMIRAVFELLGNATKEDKSTGTAATAGETRESVDMKIADLRANKDLDRQEIGRRLEPLYKIKAALQARAEKAA